MPAGIPNGHDFSMSGGVVRGCYLVPAAAHDRSRTDDNGSKRTTLPLPHHFQRDVDGLPHEGFFHGARLPKTRRPCSSNVITPKGSVLIIDNLSHRVGVKRSSFLHFARYHKRSACVRLQPRRLGPSIMALSIIRTDP